MPLLEAMLLFYNNLNPPGIFPEAHEMFHNHNEPSSVHYQGLKFYLQPVQAFRLPHSCIL
jgi:hypothetical protein